MDEQVHKAMRRWPDVPNVYGWLRLDRRGRWFLIDRNKPGFSEEADGAGSQISSAQIIEFIARNYSCDDQNRWFWQNGPQRAFVDLDAAPLIARVIQMDINGDVTNGLVTHTGYPIETVNEALIGPDNGVYLQTNLGPACVHDMDLASLDTDGQSLRLLGKQLIFREVDDISDAMNFDKMPRAPG